MPCMNDRYRLNNRRHEVFDRQIRYRFSGVERKEGLRTLERDKCRAA